MNQNLFFSSVCNVKTAILEYERDSSLQKHLLQQQKNLSLNDEIDTNRKKRAHQKR